MTTTTARTLKDEAKVNKALIRELERLLAPEQSRRSRSNGTRKAA